MSSVLLARGFYDAGLGKLLTTPTVGGLAVLLAAWIAYRSNNRKIEEDRSAVDRKIAADREASDRQLAAARDEAVRTRRGEAYVAVLQVVGTIGQWAQRVASTTEPGPAQPQPELIGLELQAPSYAQLQVYGSERVQMLWRTWNSRVNNIVNAVQLHNEMEAAPPDWPGRDHKLWFRLHGEMRPAEQKARDELAAQMNRELTEAGPASKDEPQAET